MREETEARLSLLRESWVQHGAAFNLVGGMRGSREQARQRVSAQIAHSVDVVQLVRECATARGLGDAPSWLDIGSGGGLPGLVVAAVCPDWPLTLVEPRERRVAFLRLILGRLGSEGRVLRGRIGPDQGWESMERGSRPVASHIVSSRAVFAPQRWIDLASPWSVEGGLIVVHADEVHPRALGSVAGAYVLAR